MEHNIRKCLWYKRPAESWIEGLPIGNGRLGAMVEGGVNRDHMYINEESIWAGHETDCVRTDAKEAVKEVQRLIFSGDTEAAETVVMRDIIPEKRWFGSYQLMGELTARFLKTLEYQEYERRLDLDTGLAEVEFGEGESTWRKEYFASAPHQVLAVRYICHGKETLDMEITLSREKEARISSPEKGCLMIHGHCGGNGIGFAGSVLVVSDGGNTDTVQIRKGADPSLYVRNARTVDIFVSCRTDFTCKNYLEQCRCDVEAARDAGYEQVKQKHLEEYQRYAQRFEIGFHDGNENVAAGLSTYERIRRIQAGGRDENFYALLVHYYRYLLLSSSRPGCLPSNLQGLWNCRMFAPWESDYHTNVNLQINYWPAEGYHLSECHTPLFDWLERVAESGAKTAGDYYEAEGWVLHHASNVFAHTAPCAVPAGMWPFGGAWLVRHLYEHYLYNGDVVFLKNKAYPLMKGAALFLMDFLVEVPEGMDGSGYLVTNPSHSPENRFYTRDGRSTTFTYGATMDFEIIRDLLGNCLDAIEVIRKEEPGFEMEFEERYRQTLKRIPPLRISERTGGIQEWIGDYEEVDPGHRHLSHLYGVYPGRQITLEKTPELARAAKCSLERKLENNYDGQGWSLGWMSCIWARLREPERAYDALRKIVMGHMQHNLFLEAHGNPQVGDAQGIPAAILEMLVQTDGERVELLPALPKQWNCGWVKGLRIPGGRVIDMKWKDGKIEEEKTSCFSLQNRKSVCCESELMQQRS